MRSAVSDHFKIIIAGDSARVASRSHRSTRQPFVDRQRNRARISRAADLALRLRLGVSGKRVADNCEAAFPVRRFDRQRHWLVEGMYVYRKHHDPRIGGGEWETYAEAHDSHERNAGNTGSPYVPLDSWIYPAMERLAGLGLLNDEFLECARGREVSVRVW